MKQTATMRFQRILGRLLEDRKRAGDKAAKGTLASYCGRDAQSWVSNMLHPVRATQPNLEDLENIADFFRVSISGLLRPAAHEELTPDEQRLVLAFRSVADVVQTHFLAILEAASISANLLAGKRLRYLKSSSITSEIETSHGAGAGGTLSASEFAALRDRALSLSVDLARIFKSPTSTESTPSADAGTTGRRTGGG